MTPPEVLAYREFGTGSNEPGWRVRVVPNMYPALSPELESITLSDRPFESMAGFGYHEVVIETPFHYRHMGLMERNEVEEVLWAWRDRTLSMEADPRIQHVLIFKNHGYEAGATLEHPHSQIVAASVVPQRVAEEMAMAQEYHAETGRCLWCDVTSLEIEQRKRLVTENDLFVALCPYASTSSYEVSIVPKRHQTGLSELRSHDVGALASILRDVLRRLYIGLDDPPYNLWLHQAPARLASAQLYHWHLEIVPRLSKWAGYEGGSGFYINQVPPEEAANFLRGVSI